MWARLFDLVLGLLLIVFAFVLGRRAWQAHEGQRKPTNG